MENKINIAELLKDCPTGMELDCAIYENVTLVQVQEGYDYPIVIETPNGQMLFSKYGCFSKNELAKCVIFPKGKTTWEGFQRPFKDGDILFVKATYSWIIIYKESIYDVDLYKYVGISDLPDYPPNTFMVYDCNSLCHKKDVSEIRIATEEEKQKLFDAIKTNGYKWNPETKTLEKLIEPKFKIGDRIIKRDSIVNSWIISSVSSEYYGLKSPNNSECIGILRVSEQDDYELVPTKFDITTLVPFESRVLMRSSNAREWVATFYSHYSDNKFYGCGMCCDQCIPYEGNEHLLGKKEDCDEYFKNW